MSTLFRLAGFRAALAYTGILLVAMGLVLGLLYARLAADLQRTQDNLIWRDAAVYSFTYQRDGLRGLAEAVTLVEAAQGRYVRLSNRLGRYIAGNLPAFPNLENTDQNADIDGWLSFTHDGALIRGRMLQIDDDVLLLVGQDVSEGASLLAAFRRAFALALLAMLLVGLGGGAFLARRGLKRVERIVEELQPVGAGDLSARVSETDAAAEWQVLQSQINAMLAQLEKLMQATRQVSDNLAHDLRAPLTRLRARLEALLADTDSDDVAGALEDVDALLKSFNALLTLSRLESGVSTLRAAPVHVATLLGEMHDLFAPVFEDKAMQLTLLTDNGPAVFGDAGLLAQALVNGLENVLAHAAITDSTVELANAFIGDEVMISIADAGAGIAADKRAAAVERFVQLDESRAQGGSGLGLSLIKAIVAHHDGRLALSDNRPGLRVEIYLPVKGG